MYPPPPPILSPPLSSKIINSLDIAETALVPLLYTSRQWAAITGSIVSDKSCVSDDKSGVFDDRSALSNDKSGVFDDRSEAINDGLENPLGFKIDVLNSFSSRSSSPPPWVQVETERIKSPLRRRPQGEVSELHPVGVKQPPWALTGTTEAQPHKITASSPILATGDESPVVATLSNLMSSLSKRISSSSRGISVSSFPPPGVPSLSPPGVPSLSPPGVPSFTPPGVPSSTSPRVPSSTSPGVSATTYQVLSSSTPLEVLSSPIPPRGLLSSTYPRLLSTSYENDIQRPRTVSSVTSVTESHADKLSLSETVTERFRESISSTFSDTQLTSKSVFDVTVNISETSSPREESFQTTPRGSTPRGMNTTQKDFPKCSSIYWPDKTKTDLTEYLCNQRFSDECKILKNGEKLSLTRSQNSVFDDFLETSAKYSESDNFLANQTSTGLTDNTNIDSYISDTIKPDEDDFIEFLQNINDTQEVYDDETVVEFLKNVNDVSDDISTVSTNSNYRILNQRIIDDVSENPDNNRSVNRIVRRIPKKHNCHANDSIFESVSRAVHRAEIALQLAINQPDIHQSNIKKLIIQNNSFHIGCNRRK
eukprot:GHVL01044349.1.p1 GENE.GHVL01044349.1~~GHVL01044349.1.p1  ORF type:complete len:594 (+),score=165.70 GHVL01044349.1:161-1942(+)